MTEGAGQGAVTAQVARQAAGVNPHDGGNPVLHQEGLEGARGAPVGGHLGEVAHHDAATVRHGGLVVGGRHAVVTDVGVGEGNDLAGVTRVSDDLLVAAEGRIKDELTRSDARGRQMARGVALEGGAVSQNK